MNIELRPAFPDEGSVGRGESGYGGRISAEVDTVIRH
jgi:hypothetical protein